MGVLDKIVHPHGSKTKTAHDQNEAPLYSGSERRSIEQQSGPYGSGTGNHTGQTGTSSGADALRHPVQSATGSGGQGYGQTGSSGTGSHNPDYNNDGYGDHSTRDKMQAHNPVDPRSVRGQNAIYDSSNRTNDRYGDQGTDRSHHGISNPMSNDNNYGSGARNENYNAVPTAGGEKVGGLDSGSGHHGHHGQSQSHAGRDAALGAGAGAIGVGEYERRNQPGHHGHHDQSGMSGGQYGSTNQQDGAYPSYPDERSSKKHHGIGGHHDESSSKHHHTGSQDKPLPGMPSSTEPQKLGGAYEAGYRDAMKHMEAERQRQL